MRRWSAASRLVALTAADFDRVVFRADLTPVLVEFAAPGCRPCREMEAELEELARELDGEAIIATVNVDDEPGLADAAQVSVVPTLVIFVGGAVEDVLVGRQSKATLRQKLVAGPRPVLATA